MATVDDVFWALVEFDRGQKTWDEVKEIATGVKYAPFKATPFEDPVPGNFQTFGDACTATRLSKEQKKELWELRAQ